MITNYNRFNHGTCNPWLPDFGEKDRPLQRQVLLSCSNLFEQLKRHLAVFK